MNDPYCPHCKRSVRRWMGGVWLAVLVSLARAGEPPAGVPAVAAPKAPGATESPMPLPEPVPAPVLAKTPSAETVVAEDPDLEVPAQELVIGLARRDFRSGDSMDNVNRDAVAGRMEAAERPVTVEESGSILRHVRRRSGWRGVADLFNPLAPTPPTPTSTVLRVEGGEGALDLRPRRNVLADGIWVEHGIRLW